MPDLPAYQQFEAGAAKGYSDMEQVLSTKSPLCSHFTEQGANPRAAAQRAAAAAPCQRECVFRVSQQACCIGKVYQMSADQSVLTPELTAMTPQPGLG